MCVYYLRDSIIMDMQLLHAIELRLFGNSENMFVYDEEDNEINSFDGLRW